MTKFKKSTPSVSVILCNYNGERFLSKCLSTLKKSKYPNFKVTFVDDGSTDNSLIIYKSIIGIDKRFDLLLNKKNLGLTKCRNKAIKLTRSNVIIFLDNDTEVESNWINELVHTLYSDSKVGGAQSKLVDFHNRNLIQIAGIKLIPQTAWGAPISQWEKKDSYNQEETIIGLGAALAVKREVVDRIGGFDELLVHFTDDLDYSWRIWISGYQIRSCPKSTVYHYTKSASTKRIEGGSMTDIYFHLCKNSIRSIIKNYELKNVFRFLCWSMIINFARGILVLIRRGKTDAFIGTIKGVIWNIYYIKNTIRCRKNVQKYRRTSDREIINYAMVNENILEIYRKYFIQTNLL